MASRLFEILTGALVLVLAIGFLFFALRGSATSGGSGYELRAEFEDAAGLRAGTMVTIAGVKVGRVTSVTLNEFYYADVRMRINQGVTIPEDSELAWRQSDLIGSPSLSIVVFDSSSEPLLDGDQFSSVDPADNFFELLSNLASQSAASDE